jgi:hypothetical protein
MRCFRPVWEHRGVTGGFVRVYSAPTVLEGELTKARLEHEGIPVLLKGEGAGTYRVGPVHLFVPEELEVQARLVVEAIRSGEYAVPPDEPDA